MTKAELIKAWAGENPTLTQAQYEAALNSLCNVIAAELLGGGEVALPHLGKFKTSRTAARAGRNPRTGEAIDVPAKTKAVFVMGKELKEALN